MYSKIDEESENSKIAFFVAGTCLIRE